MVMDLNIKTCNYEVLLEENMAEIFKFWKQVTLRYQKSMIHLKITNWTVSKLKTLT